MSDEITAHEIGHSFANLADEYFAGDIYLAEKPNMTQETNPSLVKWKNWLGFNGTGINQYCCGGNSALWYKPSNNCKMQYLNYPYCSVCQQTIVESIHHLINTIVSYSPINTSINTPNQNINFELSKLMQPNPNTLKIVWQLDDSIISNNTISIQINQEDLSFGIHSLVATVTDTSDWVRVDNHAGIHFSTVTWTINKFPVGIDVHGASNKIAYSAYPNPTSDLLNITLELDQKAKVAIRLIGIDGQIVRQIETPNLKTGKLFKKIHLADLANGTYFLAFNIDGKKYVEKIIKQ